MFEKRTVRDIDAKGRRILVRVDFNVPIKEGIVADDTRIRASLATIQYLVGEGAKVILCSHLGRPKGVRVPELSLKPVAGKLSALLGQKVHFAEDCVGASAEDAVQKLGNGEILLLENTRFHPEEKANDPEFAAKLASLAELFVNDAFGSAHRAHASTEGVARNLPSVAGFLMEKEISNLGKILKEPEHPFIVILGGAKVSDKIDVIRNLQENVDQFLIGGGMANTFLAAMGHDMGESLVEPEAIDTAEALLSQVGEKIILPDDAVIADAFKASAQRRVTRVDSVPEGWRVLDIGPASIQKFGKRLQEAKLVFWNGPMGVFEFPAFAEGTNAIANAVAECGAISVIGGGDSAAAIQQAGVADRINHVSTGGGAALEFLGGKTLPGIAVLDDR
jgi:phosphoglycerate kinase